MDRATTPPPRITRSSQPISPRTPEVARRIEENRLKAKARRDQYEAEQRQRDAAANDNRTPSGFAASNEITVAGRKRAHGATTAASGVPETQRDARNASKDGEAGYSNPRADGNIQATRKFAKYVEYDFSKMTDTKGGFLSAEDDPFNKALHSATAEKPAHMTLKEWERKQLMDSLRSRREGPYQPGLSVLDRDKNKKCRECGSVEIDWTWEDVLKCCVCNRCKEKFPEKYSLLTKTEAKDDYLLTDREFLRTFPSNAVFIDILIAELKDPELLPHLSKPNPHKSHWHDMMLFLRYQVEEYAFGTKWGSAEALDAEFEKRESDKKRRKEDKFNAKLRELKKKTRAEAYRRNMKTGTSGGAFGDAIAGGRHEHEWGREVENAEGITVKTCVDCGMEVEVLEF
ncbi:MAG: hypothetical protein M1818_003915 [Claussenomyces sp. TS43310]|nr:MAG: hypothetical protein M1818_003915 [Claussenomyces sp. TS43310]